jgi:type VI protein secretion system component Hcp
MKVFVKLEGIRGTATGRTHPGWVTALSYSFGGSNSGGSRVHGFEPTFTRLSDSSSPDIFSRLVNGTNFKTVIIEAENNGVVNVRLELSDALISSYSSSGGENPTETFSLSAIGAKWSHIGTEGGRSEWAEIADQ